VYEGPPKTGVKRELLWPGVDFHEHIIDACLPYSVYARPPPPPPTPPPQQHLPILIGGIAGDWLTRVFCLFCCVFVCDLFLFLNPCVLFVRVVRLYA